jgi:hypothetical protein
MERNSAMRRCHGRDRSGNLQPNPKPHHSHCSTRTAPRVFSPPNAPQPSAGTFQNPSTPSKLIRFAEPATCLAGGSRKRKTCYIHGRRSLPPSHRPRSQIPISNFIRSRGRRRAKRCGGPGGNGPNRHATPGEDSPRRPGRR